MNKKQNYSAILAGIAVTAILVASSIIAGNQFTQQAHAQANTTSSTASTTTPRPAAGTPPEPRVGQTVNWQGTVSSTPTPLAGGKGEVAVLLPLRKDGGLYTGVVTFTASKSVQVEVWNVLSGVNATMAIGKQFGKLAIAPSPNGKGFVATSLVGTGDTSGSVPFTGNAVALSGKSPFIATYSLTAQSTAGKVTNNLASATALAAATGGGATSLGGAGTTGPLSLGGGATTSGGSSSGGGGGSSSGGGGGSSSGGSSSGGGGGSSSGGSSSGD
jgi:hypothetical protein